MKTLSEIWLDLSNAGYTTDKNTVHSYVEVYQKILEPYRGSDKTILEVGLFEGNSLRMWERYFNGDVYGIDCSETPHEGLADLRPMIRTGMFNIVICDATDENEIGKHFGNKKWSVVLDDGSHDLLAQLKIIDIFKNKMEPGGLIVVEDIQEIDKTRTIFENLNVGKRIEVIDRRHIKNRYDDVLVLIYF